MEKRDYKEVMYAFYMPLKNRLEATQKVLLEHEEITIIMLG